MPLKKIQKNKVRKTCAICGRKRYIRDLEQVHLPRDLNKYKWVCIYLDTCNVFMKLKEKIKQQKQNELLKKSKHNSKNSRD